MTAVRAFVLGVTLVTVACGGSRPSPAALEPGVQPCAYCRMIVVDRHFASQIVSPDDEPRFFDDLGCLGNYLKTRSPLSVGSAVYVADHRTGDWVALTSANYTRVDEIAAPMGSHIIAHATTASRDADHGAVNGVAMKTAEVFPAGLPEQTP
jgi:copper chaperone NosL